MWKGAHESLLNNYAGHFGLETRRKKTNLVSMTFLGLTVAPCKAKGTKQNEASILGSQCCSVHYLRAWNRLIVNGLGRE